MLKANATFYPNPVDRAALRGAGNYGWNQLNSYIRSSFGNATPMIPTGNQLALAGGKRLLPQVLPKANTQNLSQHIQAATAGQKITLKDMQESELAKQTKILGGTLYQGKPQQYVQTASKYAPAAAAVGSALLR